MLFDPLGMKDTAAIFPDEQTKNRLVTLYAKDPDGNLVPGPDFFDKKHLPGKENEAGWARLYSSVEDYSRLLQMLACGGVYDGTRLMSSTTIDLMRTNGLTREQLLDFPDKGYGYGLGFRTVIDPAAGDLNGSIGAFGWTGGFGSWCEADPAENYLFRKTTKKYQIYTRQLSFSFSHYSTTGLVLSIRQYLLSTSTYYQHKASVKYLFH